VFDRACQEIVPGTNCGGTIEGELRAGVQNLFNKAPPISDFNPGDGGPGTPGYSPGNIAGGGAYDLIGRRYYGGVKMSF
jgi:outer membrane receptor protein involved in Fe transport